MEKIYQNIKTHLHLKVDDGTENKINDKVQPVLRFRDELITPYLLSLEDVIDNHLELSESIE